MYIDRKWLFIIMGILLIGGIISLSQARILSLILTLPGLLIAITFHEYAHAYAAVKLGDDTPRIQGRLSLNPLTHLDTVGSVLLLFTGIGWGKPVQINPRNFDRKVTMEQGEAIVSVAGPLTNIVLAFILTVIYFFLGKYMAAWLFTTQIGILVNTLIQAAIFTNIGLGVFNLIPLPPLDGSKIFINFMPYNARRWIQEHEQIFYIVFLVIWFTGMASFIISPIIDGISSGIFWLVSKIFSFL